MKPQTMYEPESLDGEGFAIRQDSIAISLKRIADFLEAAPREPVEVTDEMARAAIECWWDCPEGNDLEIMKAAIRAAMEVGK